MRRPWRSGTFQSSISLRAGQLAPKRCSMVWRVKMRV
jgi:hypothetical protein